MLTIAIVVLYLVRIKSSAGYKELNSIFEVRTKHSADRYVDSGHPIFIGQI